MYRWNRLTPSDKGHKKGQIIHDEDLKPESIALFLTTGTLVKVSTPPLSEIPAFEKRAELLEPVGIITIEDLVEANPSTTGKKIKKAAVTIRRWQSEAMKWLEPPKEKKESN